MHLKKYLSEDQRIFLQNYNLDKPVENVLIKLDKKEISKDQAFDEISEILQDAIRLSKENNLVAVLCEGEHQLYKFLERGRDKEVFQIIEQYSKIVGAQNLLVEIVWDADFETNQRLIEICKKLSVRAVISPNPRYINMDEEEAYKAVLAIGEQKKLSEIEIKRSYNLPSAVEIETKFADLIQKYPEILIKEGDPILQNWNCKIRTDYGAFASEAYFPIVDLESFDKDINELEDSKTGLDQSQNIQNKPQNLKSEVLKLENDDKEGSIAKNYGDYLAWEAYIGLLEKIGKIPEDFEG